MVPSLPARSRAGACGARHRAARVRTRSPTAKRAGAVAGRSVDVPAASAAGTSAACSTRFTRLRRMQHAARGELVGQH